MKLSQILRRNAFWFYDLLRGYDIRNHYRDVKKLNEHPQSEFSIKKRSQYLNNILDHAVKTSKFYSNYSEYDSIHDFPIINKNMIRDHFDDLKSSK